MIILPDKLTAKTVDEILGESAQISYTYGESNVHRKDTVANRLNLINDEMKNLGGRFYEKKEKILINENGIHQVKGATLYPVAHPNLSTKPSLLSQTFDNLPIKEILVRNGYEDDIPSDVKVINAFSFNGSKCVPACVKKTWNMWSITHDSDFEPAFTLVKYMVNTPLLCTLTMNDGSTREIRGNRNTLYGGDIHIGGEQNISSAVISENVTSIGDTAFESCTGLTSITIPDSVTSIDAYAFQNCSSLTSVTCLAENVPTTGTDAFFDVPQSSATLYVPSSSIEAYSSADQWKEFGTITDTVILSGKCGDNVSYKLYSYGELNIYGSGPTYDFDSGSTPWFDYASGITTVTIERGISALGKSIFEGCEKLEFVNIPKGVTSIGNGAFSRCFGLKFVTIPNSVTSIGNSTFEACSGLSSVTIPDRVTSIGDYAFNGCSSLTSVTIPNSVTTIGNGAFSHCTGLTSVTIPNSIMSIGSNAFSNCSGLTSVTIPNSVTSIGGSAFSGCSSLTSITIPNSVTSIGTYAFSICTGLTSVTCLAENVPTTGMDAFEGVPKGSATLYVPTSSITAYSTANQWKDFGTIHGELILSGRCGDNVNFNLYGEGKMEISGSGEMSNFTSGTSPWNDYISGITSVTIESGVTSIGYAAFAGCASLTSITIPNSVTSIGENAFNNCSGLTSITIPNDVTSIGIGTFYGCSGLTSITIPNSVTSIGERVFYNCTGLTSVTIGNGVTSIGTNTFFNCSSLTSVTIPDSVTSIGNQAFRSCTGLTSVTIGNGVTSIGEYAFYGCTGLTSVICLTENVPTTGDNVFGGVDQSHATLYVPSSSIEAYSAANQWKEFGTITGITVISGSCGADVSYKLYSEIGELDIYGTGAMSGFTEGTTPWNDYSSGITSVTIESGVTTIGKYTFSNCSSLTSVTIPDSVKSIGSYAFSGCSGLTSITIPNRVTIIGGSAFLGCTGLTSITIPNGVTSIGSGAFNGCSGLTSIIIPNSVTSIGSYAFNNCTSLTSVTIGNSVTSIREAAFINCRNITSMTVESGNTVYNSDGNCNAIIETASNTLVSGCKNTVIPNTVTSIGDNAFRGHSGLTSITIPNSVTSIGDYAFRNCSGLTSMECQNSTAPTIQSGTFQNVKTNGTLYVPVGSTGYDTWMQNASYYLGKFNWTKVEQ